MPTVRDALMHSALEISWQIEDLENGHHMFGCRTRLLTTPKRACNLLLSGFNRVDQHLKSNLVPQFTWNLA